MPKYLSKEWHEEFHRMSQKSQPERPGVNARMQQVVTGAPEGDVKYYWVINDGKLTECSLGELEDAEFTLTMVYDDAVQVQKGELDPNAAFMQGRMKVSGNMAKLLSLLPLTNAPEYKKLQEDIRAVTEF